MRVGLRSTPRLGRLREPLRPAPLPRNRPTSSQAQPRETGQPVTLSGTLAGQIAFDGLRVTVPDLRMDSPEGRLVLRGFVDVSGRNPRLDLHGRLEADLARAARLIPVSLTPSAASGDSKACAAR